MQKVELPDVWWLKKSPNKEVLKEVQKLIREVRRILVKFRKWYFDNPKDWFEKWIKRGERLSFWLILIIMIWELKSR